eukprot:2868073-Rhodomonas_salina.2
MPPLRPRSLIEETAFSVQIAPGMRAGNGRLFTGQGSDQPCFPRVPKCKSSNESKQRSKEAEPLAFLLAATAPQARALASARGREAAVSTPPRNPIQETAFSVQIVPRMRFLVLEFAVQADDHPHGSTGKSSCMRWEHTASKSIEALPVHEIARGQPPTLRLPGGRSE